MKDYYDIGYLSRKFDFKGEILADALKKTFDNRGRDYTQEQFKRVMEAVIERKAYKMCWLASAGKWE